MRKISLTIAALSLLIFDAVAQNKPEPVHALVNDKEAVSKEVIRATHDFRERLLADPYRPAYHFSFPEDNGRPGDPNGAFYHDGLYHLMFLYSSAGRGFAWGHASSQDMLHWRYHPDALVPGEGDEGVFSGGAFVDDDGTAVLSYWMLWGAKGIGLARSSDPNFNSWKKSPDNPVIKSTDWGVTDFKDESGKTIHIGSADPSNIWKKNGMYYMLTGNLLVLNKYGRTPGGPIEEKGDRVYLFESKDLKDWKYLHRFYESQREWTDTSEDDMCPSFLPLPSSPEGGPASDKHLLLFISHNKGCQYYVGDYRNDKFFPEKHGRMTWVDNAYFAPEALIDAKGRQIMWAWMFDDRPDSVKNYYGWTGMYGLPRTLWLRKDGSLGIRPVKELETLRRNERLKTNLKIKQDSVLYLENFGSELMELDVTMQPGDAQQVGVMVNCSEDGREKTVLYYDAAKKQLKFDTKESSIDWGRKIVESAPLDLSKNEPLHLRVFIDKGVIEIFANDRQAIGRCVYPKLKGTGIKFFAKGGDVKITSVKAWDMSAANAY